LKNSKIAYYLLIILFQIPGLLNGQVSVTSSPASFKVDVVEQLSFIELQQPEKSSESSISETVLPLLAGSTIVLDEKTQHLGHWDIVKNDPLIWRIGLSIPGASGLNVYFRNLELKEGDKLFIYNANKTKVLGAFTQQNNAVHFGVGFLSGDSIIIEFNTQSQKKCLPFIITEIGIANKLYGTESRDFGDAGKCEVLVNCEEGENWQYEKDGVARVLVKEGTKLFWCTGSLVNNTNNDGTPYFLTANHCGINANTYDYGAWIFYFNYEANNCDMPLYEPDDSHNLIGAELLAHSHYDVDLAADFKLLILTEDIPDDFRVFYNGWDRSGVLSSSGVTIHHPQGDLKMISTYEEPIVSVDYYNTEPNEDGRYWKANWSETANGHGVTEGGSSGCPLFNSGAYLIGTLTGGDASCSFPIGPDYYGKLSYAWESEGSDSSRQLKYWLDPTNSGVLSLKGTNLDSTNVFANFSSDVTEVSIGERIQFFNHSIGNITAYEWNFEGGDPSYSEDENPSVIRYDTFGVYSVKLIASSSNGADSLIREDYIKVLLGLSPNPSNNGIYKLSFGKDIPDDIHVEVFDFSGRQISPVFLKKKNDGFYINLSTHPAGMYLIYIRTESSQQVLKAMYTKYLEQ